MLYACIVPLFLLIAITPIGLRRHPGIADSPGRLRRMDLIVASLGLTIALAIQSAKLVHFNANNSLPLHICQLLLYIAPLAILTNRPGLRALTYFWGLGVSPLCFLIPDRNFAAANMEFFLFWIGHITIIALALYDAAARRYRPTWSHFFTAVAIGILYTLIIFPIDLHFHLDYGYLGQTPRQTLVLADAFGPWPQRVPLMLLTAILLMFLLQLPRLSRQNRKRARAVPTATG